MAEARMAVAPTPALQRTGFEVDTTAHETQMHLSSNGVVLYVPHPRFLLRNARRQMWHGWNKIKIAFLPLPIGGVIGFVAAIAVWVSTSSSTTWQRSGFIADMLWKLDSVNPLTKHFTTKTRVAYLAANFSAVTVLAFSAFQRFVLRQLLAYHGWLAERGKPSWKTVVWGVLLKYGFIRRIQANIFAYQGALPTLPLPPLDQTVTRYLTTVKPLLPAAEYAELEQLAKQFLAGDGPKLQRWLRLKWLTSPNYISDWWLDYVYLRGRDSLCINSNWYGVMYTDFFPTTSQVARAASVTYSLVTTKVQLDDGNFEPQAINGLVPMCMDQYKHIFSSTRVPGAEQDRLVKYESAESRHIAVLHRGRIYKMPVFSPKSNRPLTPLQLEGAFRGIIENAAAAPDDFDELEALLPSVTAAKRSEWAAMRDTLMRDSYNRAALETIEKAVFVLSLDDEEPAKTLSEEGMTYFTGNGKNRWSDKSFTVIITKNAKCGFHAEHSWGDAPVLAHMIEIVSCNDEYRVHYDAAGDIKPLPEDLEKQRKGVFTFYPAERVRFNLRKDFPVREVFAAYRKEIDDVDLYIERFNRYGKGLCKKAKCSPDAWIQMALQVAYFRDQGEFVQTYESSMTRLFNLGRTETIRTVSDESCAFVRALLDPAVPKPKTLELLRAACDRHQAYSHMCMTGNGVDRHLFGLYVVNVGKQVNSPFLAKALGRKWKLSTSQVPTRQLPSGHHPDLDKFQSPNGGFGPVADDGYGVSYSIFGENTFYFNVSSKKSAKNTDSRRMHDRICQALIDMGALVA